MATGMTFSRSFRGPLLAIGLTILAGVLVVLVSGSLRAPVPSPLATPPDSACAGRPYAWARADTTQSLPAEAEPFADAAFRGDSVRLTNVSFRPGNPGQLVWSGLLHNGTESTIEIRGYHLEFLSATGEVVGWRGCRIRMGAEQCGVHGTNLKRPREVALIPDTLAGAPESADADTARIFWSYCAHP
jgi:hypothetical protein